MFFSLVAQQRTYSLLETLGTTLVLLDTISATLVPQVGARADFRRFPSESLISLAAFFRKFGAFVRSVDRRHLKMRRFSNDPVGGCI